MKVFAFKAIDNEGEDTLNTIALANHFNRWMYETIKPFCKGEILEVGSGVGNISEFFLKDRASICLTDIREGYCNSLREKFSGSETLQGIQTMDLVDPGFEGKFSDSMNRYDTVFALNVVEHIFDDAAAISNCRKLLKPGGHLIILVPAFQSLYNNFDRELEHYRRYNRKRLKSLLMTGGFSVKHSQYYNAAGIAGWFISGKIQNHSIIPAGQIRLFDKLVFPFRMFDKLIFNSIGLSVIAVGEK